MSGVSLDLFGRALEWRIVREARPDRVKRAWCDAAIILALSLALALIFNREGL